MTVSLTTLQLLQGVFTLAMVVISSFSGLIIMLKYQKYKQKQLLFVGITWIFLGSPYWGDAISFLLIIFTGAKLDWGIYFFLANAFIAPLHITWIIVITNFLYKSRKKLMLLVFSIEAIIFETIFLVLYFSDITLIGAPQSAFYVRWNPIIIFYLLFSIFLFLITGLLFTRESLKSRNKEIRLKGKSLIVAFISFSIGTFLDSAFDLSQVPPGVGETIVVLARTFVIIAAFAFYIGFILPESIKKHFLKDSE
ncbi:MAG: hypothetical protein R6U96_14800 [Promethearchaeia archaeon]